MILRRIGSAESVEWLGPDACTWPECKCVRVCAADAARAASGRIRPVDVRPIFTGANASPAFARGGVEPVRCFLIDPMHVLDFPAQPGRVLLQAGKP